MSLLVAGAAAAIVDGAMILGRAVIVVVVMGRLVVGIARVIHIAVSRRDRAVARLNVIHRWNDRSPEEKS